MLSNRVVYLGILLGLLTPVIGIFIGLQVSSIGGTILLLPIIALSFLLGTPIGMFDGVWWVIGLFSSIVFWTGVLLGLKKLFSYIRSVV